MIDYLWYWDGRKMEVEKEMRLGCVMVVVIGREGRYRDYSVEAKDCCRPKRRRTVTLLQKTDSGEQTSNHGAVVIK